MNTIVTPKQVWEMSDEQFNAWKNLPAQELQRSVLMTFTDQLFQMESKALGSIPAVVVCEGVRYEWQDRII